MTPMSQKQIMEALKVSLTNSGIDQTKKSMLLHHFQIQLSKLERESGQSQTPRPAFLTETDGAVVPNAALHDAIVAKATLTKTIRDANQSLVGAAILSEFMQTEGLQEFTLSIREATNALNLTVQNKSGSSFEFSLVDMDDDDLRAFFEVLRDHPGAALASVVCTRSKVTKLLAMDEPIDGLEAFKCLFPHKV